MEVDQMNVIDNDGSNNDRGMHGKEADEMDTSEIPQSSVVDEIRFYIQKDHLLTLDWLNDTGQAIVRPLLESFVDEIGNDIARNCLVELC